MSKAKLLQEIEDGNRRADILRRVDGALQTKRAIVAIMSVSNGKVVCSFDALHFPDDDLDVAKGLCVAEFEKLRGMASQTREQP